MIIFPISIKKTIQVYLNCFFDAYWKDNHDLSNVEKMSKLIRDLNIDSDEFFQSIKDQSVKDIANKAISKKTGARGLRSILENILLKTMFDLPSQDNIEEVIIDSGAAKGVSAPVIVHSKNKTKTDKTSAA